MKVMDETKKPLSLEQVRANRIKLKNTHEEVLNKISILDSIALWITNHVGTMAFFLLVFAWSAMWLTWNIFAPTQYVFDQSPGFVMWLFISNCIQILLMPLIMVGQNLQSRHSEARAEHDLEINIKAEQEIETVLGHLEYQNKILIAMLEKLGVDVQTIIKKVNP